MKLRRLKRAPVAKKRKCWRPSKRNAVMRLALMPRPTIAYVRRLDSEGCPICGAPASHLELHERPAYRETSTALEWLGITARRWIRGTLEIGCGECGTGYTGGRVQDWNNAKFARSFADFGKIRFPLPFEKRKKPVTQILREQLKPQKRRLIDLQKGRAIVGKGKRMRKVLNWVRSKEGKPILTDW